MTVKLVMLKSGEDIIADVKEIKSEQDVIGYFFHDPLIVKMYSCLLYTSPSPRDRTRSRMPSSA